MSGPGPGAPAGLRERLVGSIPDEPVALRAELLALVREQPAAARAAIATALYRELAERWVGSDGDGALDRGALEGALASASRETWLWVIGDRPWADTACTLAGRSARRARGRRAGGHGTATA